MTESEIEKLTEKVCEWVDGAITGKLSENEIAFEISGLIEKEKAELLKDAIELAEKSAFHKNSILCKKFLAKYQKEKI